MVVFRTFALQKAYLIQIDTNDKCFPSWRGLGKVKGSRTRGIVIISLASFEKHFIPSNLKISTYSLSIYLPFCTFLFRWTPEDPTMMTYPLLRTCQVSRLTTKTSWLSGNVCNKPRNLNLLLKLRRLKYICPFYLCFVFSPYGSPLFRVLILQGSSNPY